ncbi:MAG: cation:proton antiporter, partial [Fulvivirga sp.]|nr:cation:proton antiporter [Fulvivirga sp.]
MEIFNSYTVVIIISLVIILSYFFNIISTKTNIPSVLLLIFCGMLIKAGLNYFDINTGGILLNVLEVLGILGLIMIVLEAALDLELSREKWPLIWKSFTIALLSLLFCSFCIAWLLQLLFIDDFINSLV